MLIFYLNCKICICDCTASKNYSDFNRQKKRKEKNRSVSGEPNLNVFKSKHSDVFSNHNLGVNVLNSH